MRVGSNWCYDGREPGLDEARQIFGALNPDSVVIPSHATQDEYEWLINRFPSLAFSVRQKTGPGHLGTYPSDILDYREWENERSLRDTLEMLQSHGKTLRVVMSNEPDIEMAVEPVDDKDNREQAINAYIAWWFDEAPKIREAFPDVQLCPAPLSQGNRDRWLAWVSSLNHVYHDADYLADHCYIPVGGEPAQWGERYRWYRMAYPHKALVVYEMNDNGQYGDLNDEERAQRYAEYITQVAQKGLENDGYKADEVDVFTLPGGAADAGAPSWWFITPEMADVIAQANRNPQQQPEPQPEPIPEPEAEPTPGPEPVPVGAPMARTDNEAIEECRRYLWLAINPGLDINPEAAIYRYWVNHIEELGSPVSPELAGADNKYQAFARGSIYRWLNDGLNTVEKIA